MISNLYSLTECVVGGLLVMWGLSACVNVRSIQNFVKFFISEDNAPLTHAMFFVSSPFGLIIIFTHNDWMLDFPVVVTLLGWAITAQCALWLMFPHQMKKLSQFKLWTNPLFIRGYGAFSLFLGVMVLYPHFM